MKPLRLAIASAAALGLGLGTAVAQDSQFSASNAKLDGGDLTVDVTAPEAGWAVIHKIDDQGKPGEHIGHAQIKSGENKGVEVTLDQAVDADQLIVMLHNDKGKEGTFEYGADDKTDGPAMKDGKPVIDKVSF